MECAVISLLVFSTGLVRAAETQESVKVSSPSIVEEPTLPTLAPDDDRVTVLAVVEGSSLPTPIATSAKTFVDLIKDGNIFIDKTYMLREILNKRFDSHSHIKIFARPNGWGKSVYLQMIKAYCELTISKKTNFMVFPNRTENYRLFKRGEISVNGVVRKLREPLLIARDTETEVHLGQHPVLFMSFEEMKPKSFDEFKTGVADQFRKAFEVYDFHYMSTVLGSETHRLGVLCESIKSGKYDWDSFTYLCNTIKQFFNRQVVLLIDDYDQPLIHILNEPNVLDKKETAKKIMDFYRSLFDHMTTHRTAYFRAVLTGITRMIFDSSILARDAFDELEGAYQLRLGFTENEVNMIFDHLDLSMLLRIQGKQHYGGYRMSTPEGRTFVPSSIAQFAAARKICNFWTPNEDLDGIFDKFLRDIPSFHKDITELCKSPREENPPNACTALQGDFINDDKMEVLCDFLDGRVEISENSYQLYRVLDMTQYLFSCSGHLTRWSQIPNEEVRAHLKKKVEV